MYICQNQIKVYIVPFDITVVSHDSTHSVTETNTIQTSSHKFVTAVSISQSSEYSDAHWDCSHIIGVGDPFPSPQVSKTTK